MNYNPFNFKDAKGNVIKGRSPEELTVPSFKLAKPREAFGLEVSKVKTPYPPSSGDGRAAAPAWPAYSTRPPVTPLVTYLGEVPVNVATHPTYAQYTGADWAMLFNSMYGGIDGAHHKTWVLDQIARVLKGTPMAVTLAKWSDGQEKYRFQTGAPSAAYLAWVQEQLGDTYPDGEREYGYDEGIAP